MKTLADHLDRAGITQARLAERLNVSQPTVSDWVRGVKKPRPSKVPELARVLGIPVSRLFVDLYSTD